MDYSVYFFPVIIMCYTTFLRRSKISLVIFTARNSIPNELQIPRQ